MHYSPREWCNPARGRLLLRVSEQALITVLPAGRGEARDRGTGGAGLGLAITRQIVTLHGGSVRAVNREGGGLEVRITLPANGAAPSHLT